MKKFMMIAAALLLVISAAACGSKESEGSTSKYADGTYEGVATTKAFETDGLTVTVTVEGGQITAVEPGENKETESVGGVAMPKLAEKIVEAQGTEGVDGVAGATYTSVAFLEAVNDALAKAAN